MNSLLTYPSKSSAYLVNSRYQLLSKLGEGGFGAVYRAKDRLTHQIVALKKLRPFSAAQSNHYQRRYIHLIREFRVLSSLHHPYIVEVLDFGFDVDDRPYFTMQLVSDAQPITTAARTLNEEHKAQLLLDVLHALHYIHRNGIMHRDLKPNNILVDTQQRVKLLDFGLIAMMEQPIDPHFAGTWAYMAPEIMVGHAHTPQADLYALGVIAYELCTGRLPHGTTSLAALIQAKFEQTPDLQALPPYAGIRAFIARLLQPQPKDRYGSAFDAIQALHDALGRPYVDVAPLRESLLQAPRFIGRESEQQQMNHALDAAFKSQGSAWLLSGESGIGKSRLMSELRDMALVRGATVFTWQYYEHAAQSMWVALTRRLLLLTPVTDEELALVRGWIPDVEQLTDRRIQSGQPNVHAENLQSCFEALIFELVRRQQQPLALLIDDLHRSHESLNLLKHLCAAAPQMPLLIVGAYRSDEAPEFHTQIPDMTRLTLQPFSPNETQRLIEAMVGSHETFWFVPFLTRQAEGNPFYLVETVRSLSLAAGHLEAISLNTLPEQIFSEGILDIARRRMAHLAARHQQVLQIAAVIGNQIDFDLLRQLTEPFDEQDWLARCQAVAFLRFNVGTWSFAHDKIRESILHDLPEDLYRDLNRRVALALEALHPHSWEEYALRLAGHWREADELSKELHYLLVHIPRALRAGAFQEIRHELQRSLQRVAAAEGFTAERMRLYYYAGKVEQGITNYAAAYAHFAVSYQLAQQLDDSDYQIHSLRGLGQIEYHRTSYHDSLGCFQQALALCQQSGDQVIIGQITCEIGNLHFIRRDFTLAEHGYNEALRIGQMMADDMICANSYQGLANLAWTQQRYHEAKMLAQTALDLSQRLGYAPNIIRSLNTLLLIESAIGDKETVQRLGETIIADCQRIGDRHMAIVTLGNLASTFAQDGDYDKSRAYFERGLQLARSLNLLRLITSHSGALAQVQVLLGDWNGVRRSLREWLTTAQQMHMLSAYLHGFYGLVDLALYDRRYHEAAEWLGVIVVHTTGQYRDEAEIARLRALVVAAIGADATDAGIERARQTPLDAIANAILADPHGLLDG